MIRLNPRNPQCCHYEPPVPVERHFGPPDPDRPVESLLWIPAVLTSRFMAQYPRLRSEGDELFSAGVASVVETIHQDRWPLDKVGAVCQIRCRRAMEDYANSLTSVVKVCTTTRYENRKKGVRTPRSQRLVAPTSVGDDMTDLILRDAAEAVGVDLSDMSQKDRLRLWRVLQ